MTDSHQASDLLRDALQWVGEIYPTPTTDDAAMILITWKEWNALRVALSLPEQHPRGRKKRV